MTRATLLALTVLLAGCGAKSGTVSGEASYDGQPIEEGQITFAAEDGLRVTGP